MAQYWSHSWNRYNPFPRMKGKLTRNMSAQMMAGSEGGGRGEEGGKREGEGGGWGERKDRKQLKETGDITMVTYRPLSFSILLYLSI